MGVGQVNPEFNSLMNRANFPNPSNNNILNELPPKNFQEDNQNSRANYISFGEIGVDQTYVSNFQKKEKQKKRKYRKEGGNPQNNENAFINNYINN